METHNIRSSVLANEFPSSTWLHYITSILFFIVTFSFISPDPVKFPHTHSAAGDSTQTCWWKLWQVRCYISHHGQPEGSVPAEGPKQDRAHQQWASHSSQEHWSGWQSAEWVVMSIPCDSKSVHDSLYISVATSICGTEGCDLQHMIWNLVKADTYAHMHVVFLGGVLEAGG